MNHILSETLVPFSEVPDRLPTKKGGKRVSIATIFRWAQRGIRGIRLESALVGGERYTSDEALQRFHRAINGLDGGARVTAGPQHLTRVDDELNRMGL